MTDAVSTERPKFVQGRKPRLLDLFCCAGGAAMGYHQAGFDVVGVDVRPQPKYPFEFIQADCLTLDRGFVAGFDAVHASPPCQAHSSISNVSGNQHNHIDLIPQTRELLLAIDRPFVMENVPGAPLLNPFMLCGTMFGLGTSDEARRAMGIDWMAMPQLSQAIPPAYTRWIGRQLLAHMQQRRIAA